MTIDTPYAPSRPPRVLLALALLGTGIVRHARPVEPAPAPAITSVSPALGPSVGSTVVTITGANFIAGTTVNFSAVAATAVEVVSATGPTAFGLPNHFLSHHPPRQHPRVRIQVRPRVAEDREQPTLVLRHELREQLRAQA